MATPVTQETIKKTQSKRYYLHRVLKKKGIRYSSFKKTIYVFFNDNTEDIHIKRLQREYNYSVQFEIK